MNDHDMEAFGGSLQIGRGELTAFLLTMQPGEELSMLVTGNSMVPFLLNRRSTVYLIRDEVYEPHVGDIVLFRRVDGTYVLHRVHKIRKDGLLVINGDAQRWTELILPRQVCCHVTHFVRTKKDIRVDAASQRFYRWVWRHLRLIHGVAASGYYYWHRVPYKLGFKKDPQ